MKALGIIGFAFMIIAMLFFVAGSPAIEIMPRKYANFAGIAAGSVGILIWIAQLATARQDDKDQSE